MKLTLFPFQNKIINDTRIALRQFRNVLIQSPCGSGKTVIATFIAGSVLEKNKTLYFICHRQELIVQTAITFRKNGIPFGFIANGWPGNPTAKIQVCSIDTLKNRYKNHLIPDVCIWDEAHHLGAAGWSKVHSYYNTSYHIGLSATPQRLDGKGLGQWFDKIIYGPSVADLIEQGFLSDYKIYAGKIKPDFTEVSKRMGEYNNTEAAAIMDDPTLIGDIVQHWLKHAKGMKTICFATNIKHSKHIVAEFNAAGISALHLDKDTPKKQRKAAALAFAKGEIQIISNVMLFGEGYDLSAQTDMDVTIECVICARKTMSLSLWIQMVMRALRKKDIDAIILDHASNSLVHGLPCQERVWTLGGDPNQGKKKSENEVPIKECPKCYHVHKPAPACPECGHVYEVEEHKIIHVEGDLQELSKEVIEKKRVESRKEQGGAGSVEELIKLAKRRGYKNPAKWAAKVYTGRLAKIKKQEKLEEEKAGTIEGLVLLGKKRGYDSPVQWANFIWNMRNERERSAECN